MTIPQATMLYFARDELLPVARELAGRFRDAEPFPHVVIDGLLPTDVLHEVVAVYPEPTGDQWQTFFNEREKKFALRDEEQMPVAVRHLIQQFNSQLFIEFLEELTGIRGLVADPHLVGGGLHQIAAGGLLKVHADFNMHTGLNLERRLNVLLYLNEDWPDEYGGQLELWDAGMQHAVVRVAPVFNRIVVFETSSDSYHGHPDPLACPPGRFRRSLAWYYYTAPRSTRTAAHDTLFRARPGEDIGRPSFNERVRDITRSLRTGRR